jgi:hypothetical protein
MPGYRCTATGGADEQTSRGRTPEAFERTYNIHAESSADAEATARRIVERVEGRQPETVECELDSLVAIREASEADVTDPGRRRRLERAAAKDDARMEELEAAKRANVHWPR